MSLRDLDIAQARSKSYTGVAIITFIASIVFWPLGLVMNIMYLREAKNKEKIAGNSLPGVGCLTIQLVLVIIGLIIIGWSLLTLGATPSF